MADSFRRPVKPFDIRSLGVGGPGTVAVQRFGGDTTRGEPSTPLLLLNGPKCERNVPSAPMGPGDKGRGVGAGEVEAPLATPLKDARWAW